MISQHENGNQVGLLITFLSIYLFDFEYYNCIASTKSGIFVT